MNAATGQTGPAPSADLEAGLARLRAGGMVILVDDADRENEGDLCLAAERVSPAAINFMARHGRGLICLALTEERLAQLDLPPMVAHNSSRFGTAFTVSIEARQGVTTGISAADRAHTISTALRPDARPSDLARPGHVFPLRAQPGGVLVRAGQTEGSVDLARLAGLQPAAVICEIMNDDGTMARLPQLEAFARQHQLPIITIADLIRYRLAHEGLVRRLATATLQHPRWGALTVHAYGSSIDSQQHLVLVKGDLERGPPPLVRMHTGCPRCDVVGDLFCDCGSTLFASLSAIAAEGRGVVVYLHQEDLRGAALDVKVAALAAGAPAEADPEADGAPPGGGRQSFTLRRYGIGAQILRHLGLGTIRLLANHNFKLACLDGFGLAIAEVLALPARSEKPRLQVVTS